MPVWCKLLFHIVILSAFFSMVPLSRITATVSGVEAVKTKVWINVHCNVWIPGFRHRERERYKLQRTRLDTLNLKLKTKRQMSVKRKFGGNAGVGGEEAEVKLRK